jgi:hypothetical protein
MELMVKSPGFLAGAFLISNSIRAGWRKLPRNVDVIDWAWVRLFLSLTWDFVGKFGD